MIGKMDKNIIRSMNSPMKSLLTYAR